MVLTCSQSLHRLGGGQEDTSCFCSSPWNIGGRLAGGGIVGGGLLAEEMVVGREEEVK